MTDAPQHRRLSAIVERVYPGAQLTEVEALGIDVAEEGVTSKGTGYGAPLRLTVVMGDGSSERLVLRTATANVFGHDWRADRAAEMILAYDTFGTIPQHVVPVDVGALAGGDGFVSLRDTDEFYLLTTYVEGTVYAEHLREIAAAGRAESRHRAQVSRLARWLAALHIPSSEPSSIYTRGVRDVVGSGEGVFGIVDGYPKSAVSLRSRLRQIETACVDWRWRVGEYSHRLCRIHGDFHPFNVLIDDDRLAVLDASRGSLGDAANDVTCMAVNFIFFALEGPDLWDSAFRDLWLLFWDEYFAARTDNEMFDVAAPYLTWRLLVLSNPSWYPTLGDRNRDRLLTFAERVLAEDRFDPQWADDIFFGEGRSA